MALEGNDLFGAQEREGDHIRRMRASPEPEAPQVAVRWLAIYHDTTYDRKFPGPVLYQTYDEAVRLITPDADGIKLDGIRQVRIEL